MKCDDVKAIVVEYLTKNGYGGLLDDNGCGCTLDDLCPCGEYFGDCSPAYAHTANCGECENSCDNAGSVDVCLRTYPPSPQKASGTGPSGESAPSVPPELEPSGEAHECPAGGPRPPASASPQQVAAVKPGQE